MTIKSNDTDLYNHPNVLFVSTNMSKEMTSHDLRIMSVQMRYIRFLLCLGWSNIIIVQLCRNNYLCD